MTITKKGNCLIIELTGEIDHHSCAEIKQITDSQFEDSNVINLVLDFKSVDFMDSAGVGLVIGRYKAVKKRAGQIAITGIHCPIDRIMDISGIYKIIHRYDTVAEALKAIDTV